MFQRGTRRTDTTDRQPHTAMVQDPFQHGDIHEYEEAKDRLYEPPNFGVPPPSPPPTAPAPTPGPPSPPTASLETKLREAERTNTDLRATLEELQAAHVALETRRHDQVAALEHSQLLLKAHVRELKRNDCQLRHDHTRSMSRLHREAKERLEAAVEEERRQARNEVEAVRMEAEVVLGVERNRRELTRELARERIQAAIEEAQRGLAVLEVGVEEELPLGEMVSLVKRE
jgi:hypothetical protein